MNGKAAIVLLSSLLFVCAEAKAQTLATAQPAPSSPVAPAAASVPAERFVTIRSAGCDTLLKLSDQDRAAASMFYIGHQAARSRVKSINVGGIPTIEALALSYCAAHPDQPVAEAFAAAHEAYLRAYLE